MSEVCPRGRGAGPSSVAALVLALGLGAGCAAAENEAPLPDSEVASVGSDVEEGRSSDATAGDDTMELVDPPPGCGGTYGYPTPVGSLPEGVLVEISGIVASRRRPDLLWGHDDSGADARLVAINLTAQPVHQLMLPGVEHVDWEDIAAAPCPADGVPCLWVADIGDNLAVRDSVQIHVVAEPSLLPDDDGAQATSEADLRGTLEVTYPDGPMDMESLVVDGGGETVWLFEKMDGPTARIYRGAVPAGITGNVTLEEVGVFPSPGDAVTYGRMITGADLHPSGTRLLLRLYTGTWEYPLGQAGDIASLDAIIPALAAAGPFPEELQGEAVAYDAEGTGFWTISEDLGGVGGQALHHYGCTALQRRP